jgi:CheY-like chemotaxis protein
LTRAISGTHSPLAVVIDNNTARGNEMAGLLNQIGFETVNATTGREGFEIAAGHSNVVLVAVHANAIRWPLSQTVSSLRADARCAHIPIVIYGPDSVRHEVEGILTHYPQVKYLVDSVTVQNVEQQIGEFLKRALALATPAPEHAGRVADAVAWLAHIANTNRTNVFDVSGAESALLGVSTDPAVSADALAALAAIPTAAVQRDFQQIAVSERLEVPMRVMAARHLAAHIQRHGLLLSPSNAADLETAWRSAKSPELETALAAVIGSLKPNAKHVAGRLQQAASTRRPTP